MKYLAMSVRLSGCYGLYFLNVVTVFHTIEREGILKLIYPTEACSLICKTFTKCTLSLRIYTLIQLHSWISIKYDYWRILSGTFHKNIWVEFKITIGPPKKWILLPSSWLQVYYSLSIDISLNFWIAVNICYLYDEATIIYHSILWQQLFDFKNVFADLYFVFFFSNCFHLFWKLKIHFVWIDHFEKSYNFSLSYFGLGNWTSSLNLIYFSEILAFCETTKFKEGKSVGN